ncbi:MAG: hypothetical protein NXI30_00690 [bacterium]|nr:hypothetical protein [bacterium]
MRPSLLTRKCAFVAASIFWIASSATAELPAGLAPPGPCAEPREAVSGTAAPGSGSASPMDMVGPLQSFFSPNDVAAAPGAPARPAPSAATAVRYPGACEAGGSACQRALADSPGTRPVIPGPRGGSTEPGFGLPGAPPPPEPRPVVPGGRPARAR